MHFNKIVLALATAGFASGAYATNGMNVEGYGPIAAAMGVNENADLIAQNEKYVMRITGDSPEGKAELDNFILPEQRYPVVVTTSKLLMWPRKMLGGKGAE